MPQPTAQMTASLKRVEARRAGSLDAVIRSHCAGVISRAERDALLANLGFDSDTVPLHAVLDLVAAEERHRAAKRRPIEERLENLEVVVNGNAGDIDKAIGRVGAVEDVVTREVLARLDAVEGRGDRTANLVDQIHAARRQRGTVVDAHNARLEEISRHIGQIEHKIGMVTGISVAEFLARLSDRMQDAEARIDATAGSMIGRIKALERALADVDALTRQTRSDLTRHKAAVSTVGMTSNTGNCLSVTDPAIRWEMRGVADGGTDGRWSITLHMDGRPIARDRVEELRAFCELLADGGPFDIDYGLYGPRITLTLPTRGGPAAAEYQTLEEALDALRPFLAGATDDAEADE